MSAATLEELRLKARQLRREIITMIYRAGSGHPGGALSVLDILVILYYKVMQIDPHNCRDPQRDRLVLSKGHACPALYAVLADRGFFPAHHLKTLRKLGSILQGHPDMRKTPGVEMSTGSLGQGLSAANGMALAARLEKARRRVYVILGDGEIQEGQIWEAALTAAHYRLDNVIAFLDYNGLQIDGWHRDVKSLAPIVEKWQSFGWHTLEVDGHDYASLLEAIRRAQMNKGAPTMIIAHTIKGKGVSFMENQINWHGRAPNEEEYTRALAELEN
ncbi:MAG: transketolase [Firmicutes bacterium]|nr:transketolase [Bacillota bacterium]